jgi:hypothetical protein
MSGTEVSEQIKIKAVNIWFPSVPPRVCFSQTLELRS